MRVVCVYNPLGVGKFIELSPANNLHLFKKKEQLVIVFL